MRTTPRAAAICALLLVGPAVTAGLAAVQKPCKKGTSLGVYHAYSECRTNKKGKKVWYVVTDHYYRCPPKNAVSAFRVSEIETAQPCTKAAPGTGTSLLRELGPRDQSPQDDGEFIVIECVNGFWHRVHYQRHRLADGSVRFSKPAKALHNTLVPCKKARPPVVVGAKTATTTSATSVSSRTGAGGSIGGVVLARRPDEHGDTQLLLATPNTIGETAVDEVRIELPQRTAKRTSGAVLPPGWEMTRKKGEITFAGLPVGEDDPVAIALAVPADGVPATVDLELWGDGSRLFADSAGVDVLPPVETLDSLGPVLRLPQVISPGEQIVFRPMDLARTPPRGRWEISGVPAEATAEPADPEAIRFVYGVPLEAPLGEPLTVSYQDPWGVTLVEASAEETEVVPAPAGSDGDPAITGCTPKALMGETLCVCGRFPSDASHGGVTLNGEPLGQPLSASSRVLNFQVPAALAPGPIVVGGTPEAGFDGAQQVEGALIGVGGEINRELLLSGESTPLTLWILGTDEPISMRLQNKTPDVVSLDGGNDQMVTTSGGEPNQVRKTVHAGTPGDFNIEYTLDLDNCPCAGEDVLADDAPDLNISDDPTTTTDAADRTTIRKDLWDLREQLDRIVSGSRGQGVDNGTADTLARVESRLLAVELARLQELLATLEKGDPSSAAYADAITELVELRTRLTRLQQSRTVDVSEGAQSLIGDLDEALVEALTKRSQHLISVLQDSASSATSKAEAAAALLDIRNHLSGLTTDGIATDLIERGLDEYFRSRVSDLIAVLDDKAASEADKTTALNELQELWSTLLEYLGDPSRLGATVPPAAELLGEIEKRLVDRIRARLGELGAVYSDSATTAAGKAEALTEMFYLWDELRGLTYGRRARLDVGDTSHDDLVRDLGNRLTLEIGQRYVELTRVLTESSSGEELDAASSELLEAWERLRALGQTDTPLYADLESTLRELYRVRSAGLRGTVSDPAASDADRAAAAAALADINDHLETLDGTRRGPGDTPFKDSTRSENEDRLGRYVYERIERLGELLDSTTANAEDKEAAIEELRRLRTMLLRMGRRPASAVSGARGDADIRDIDRHLLPLATARLNELARTIESDTATAAEKRAALDGLEELREVFRDLGDETGEIETRIDKLLRKGTKQRLRQLEEGLEGGGTGGPIT